MTASIAPLSSFIDEANRLARKYPHIQNDLKEFVATYARTGTITAKPIPGFKRLLWKERVKSTDMKRGKSGGFRIIFYWNEEKPQQIHLVTIYAKTEREDIPQEEIKKILSRVVPEIFNKEPRTGTA